MQVLCTAPDVSAFEAMLSMSEKGISALAVVSDTGKLIGNFSLSELRTIMADHFGSLALPVSVQHSPDTAMDKSDTLSAARRAPVSLPTAAGGI